MKIHHLIPILILTGCASSSKIVDTDVGALPQQHQPILDESQTASIRSAEHLKAYPVGRYEDSADPDVMHEGHTVYRAETSPEWNTAPNAPTSLPMGPGEMAMADPSQEHTALTAELEQRLKQEDQLLQTTYEQNTRLADEIKAVQAQLPTIRPPQSGDQPAAASPLASSQPTPPSPPTPETPLISPPSTVSHKRTWAEWIESLRSKSASPATSTTKGNP
jgi:hypothetical protein